ncbi:MAG TPA: CBS domain-containing protein [Acidimicrobiales bacterium]
MARLGDIMTRAVFAVAPETPVAEVARSMVKGRFGSAVVTRSELLVGIFTERDVLRAAASGDDLSTSAVSRWMTADPESVGPDVDSEAAAEVMLSRGFRHLPVLDGNRLLGIVSLRDVLATRIRGGGK